MPTISQVTTITTAYLAGVFFHARSGRSPLAALRVRALGQGVGDEPGVLSCSTIPPRCTPIDISLRLTARSLGQRLCSRTVQRRSGRSPQPSPPYGQSPQLGWCSCSAHRDSPQSLGSPVWPNPMPIGWRRGHDGGGRRAVHWHAPYCTPRSPASRSCATGCRRWSRGGRARRLSAAITKCSQGSSDVRHGRHGGR